MKYTEYFFQLQEYQINVIQMYKFKLPKNMYIQYFQSLVNEKSKLWFSVNKWLKFIYYEENMQLLCVFKKYIEKQLSLVLCTTLKVQPDQI